MTFSIKHLDHVVVCVADLDRAIRFYCDGLGCTEERRVDSINLVQLRAGSSLIDLMLIDAEAESGPRNMDHFALRIDPFDEAALRSHLGGHGIEVGEVASRYGAEGQGPSMYIQDPDGNTVELKGPPS
ncbi:MAG: VOC family protein [Methyloligellaceae bacterium]